MSLLGCEWESIERHEKLRGVVSEVGGPRRERKFAASPSHAAGRNDGPKGSSAAELGITYFGHNLPKTMFKGSYLNFKEDEWLVYGVCF